MIRHHFRREPVFPWYWKDWKSDPHVAQMSLAERGAYRELLDTLWAEGTVDLDLRLLARVVRCEYRQFKRIWTVLEPRFVKIIKLRSTSIEDRLSELNNVIDKYLDADSGTLNMTAISRDIASRSSQELSLCNEKVEQVRRAKKAYRTRMSASSKKGREGS